MYVFVDMFHVCGSLILCMSGVCVTHMPSCTMNRLDESICVVVLLKENNLQFVTIVAV